MNYFTFQSDVNTVTFADESGDLIYSGSDDNLCKVACTYKLFMFDHIWLSCFQINSQFETYEAWSLFMLQPPISERQNTLILDDFVWSRVADDMSWFLTKKRMFEISGNKWCVWQYPNKVCFVCSVLSTLDNFFECSLYTCVYWTVQFLNVLRHKFALVAT
jgi:hypothetical protein